MLTAPAQNGRPIPAQDINEFYLKDGPKIFSDTAKLSKQRVEECRQGQPEDQNLLEKAVYWMQRRGVWLQTKLLEISPVIIVITIIIIIIY